MGSWQKATGSWQKAEVRSEKLVWETVEAFGSSVVSIPELVILQIMFIVNCLSMVSCPLEMLKVHVAERNTEDPSGSMVFANCQLPTGNFSVKSHFCLFTYALWSLPSRRIRFLY